MTRRTLRHFMWGYQEQFVSAIRRCAEDVLNRVGAPPEVSVMLVGVRRPGDPSRHPVCIEPEGQRWPLSLFDGLEAAVENAIPEHPMSSVFYGKRCRGATRPSLGAPGYASALNFGSTPRARNSRRSKLVNAQAGRPPI